MPCPKDTSPVVPTSRLSEVANSPIAESRMIRSVNEALGNTSGMIHSTISAANAIAAS